MRHATTIAIAILFIAGTVTGSVSELDHQLSTDKMAYRLGVEVVITYQACNTSDHLVTHEGAGACGPFYLTVENSKGDEIALYDPGPCPWTTGYWFSQWQPGECESGIEAAWPQRLFTNFNEDGWSPEGITAPPGKYRIKVTWADAGSSSETVLVSDWIVVMPEPVSGETSACE